MTENALNDNVLNDMDHDRPKVGVIKTVSGQYVDLLDPDPGTINLRDIAHGLSQINRYNGHTITPYSVAEHSIYVARMLERQYGNPAISLLGLMHDASEAYLGDITRPLKELIADTYLPMEQRMQRAIFAALHIDHLLEIDYSRVKDVDNAILPWEMTMFRDLDIRIAPPANVIAEEFITHYHRYRSEL